ncbi:MAG TPA: gephyrin-like molybdotransferase Glp, partial [Acidimicrobiia bacterium]|nr:gephyrin-like molybdotransferase Glp [Acidimicrobiia bacterium]
MKPLAAARREVVAAMNLLPEVQTPLQQSRGLVLSRAVVAAHAVPPFANSGVDGFAVRSVDVAAAPVDLEVIGDLPAGIAPTAAVRAGTAIRIMTGAPMPDGADAVVMVEDTVSAGDRVQVSRSARPGDHVRPAGGDFPAGTQVFDAGERLRAPHLGVLASIGVARPAVRRRPTVAVFSTGDELRSADTSDLPPGAIRDSNRPLLVGLLEEFGAVVKDLGIIGDDAATLRSALEQAAGVCDAIVTSGGVSMGEHDLVKRVLADLGSVEFWQVAMQPAKPFAFGRIRDTPLFGLPGNPVSAMVAFEQFV